MKLKLTVLFAILLGLSLPAYPKSHGYRFYAPSKSVCLRYGGSWHRIFEHCQTTWPKAKRICRASGGRLPSARIFQRLITICGGHISLSGDRKMKNRMSYRNCIRSYGVRDIDDFWTSTRDHREPDAPYYHPKLAIDVYGGYYLTYDSKYRLYVMCIK